MKKMLLFAVACLSTAMAFADVDIKSGSLVELKNPDARILVTWDYSKMLIEDKKPDEFLKEKGEEWVRDYPAEVAAGEAAFDMYYNKKCKKFGQITDDEEAAQYELIIHVEKFHYGSTGAAIMFGSFARGAHIEGTAEVVSRKDQKVICTLVIDCAGGAAYSNEQRRQLAAQDFAKDLSKLVSKAK